MKVGGNLGQGGEGGGRGGAGGQGSAHRRGRRRRPDDERRRCRRGGRGGASAAARGGAKREREGGLRWWRLLRERSVAKGSARPVARTHSSGRSSGGRLCSEAEEAARSECRRGGGHGIGRGSGRLRQRRRRCRRAVSCARRRLAVLSEVVDERAGLARGGGRRGLFAPLRRREGEAPARGGGGGEGR